MTAAASADPTELMAEHLSVLRVYATRVLVQGENLATSEEEDRARPTSGLHQSTLSTHSLHWKGPRPGHTGRYGGLHRGPGN